MMEMSLAKLFMKRVSFYSVYFLEVCHLALPHQKGLFMLQDSFGFGILVT